MEVSLEYIPEEKRWNVSAHVKHDCSTDEKCGKRMHEGYIMMYDCRYSYENEMLNSDPQALAEVIGLVEDVEFSITFWGYADHRGEWDEGFDRADLMGLNNA